MSQIDLFQPLKITFRMIQPNLYFTVFGLTMMNFLAPPAEWQRSFSNTDSSVVVVVVRRQLFT